MHRWGLVPPLTTQAKKLRWEQEVTGWGRGEAPSQSHGQGFKRSVTAKHSWDRRNGGYKNASSPKPLL